MNESLNTALNSVLSFVKEEDGAQVVEYALIIAVVSIGLVAALGAIGGPTSPFATFIDKITVALSTGVLAP